MVGGSMRHAPALRLRFGGAPAYRRRVGFASASLPPGKKVFNDASEKA
jgi:hypothetical protein